MLSQAALILGLISMNKSSSMPYCSATAKQLSPSLATIHLPQLVVVPLPIRPGGVTVAVAYGAVCVGMAPGTVEGVYSAYGDDTQMTEPTRSMLLHTALIEGFHAMINASETPWARATDSHVSAAVKV